MLISKQNKPYIELINYVVDLLEMFSERIICKNTRSLIKILNLKIKLYFLVLKLQAYLMALVGASSYGEKL